VATSCFDSTFLPRRTARTLSLGKALHAFPSTQGKSWHLLQRVVACGAVRRRARVHRARRVEADHARSVRAERALTRGAHGHRHCGIQSTH
jgi:hypothetical protein